MWSEIGLGAYIAKQTGDPLESVVQKKRKATVGKICRKRKV